MKAKEFLKSKCEQLDIKCAFWGNQKITAAQAIGAMEEYAQHSTLSESKVRAIVIKYFGVGEWREKKYTEDVVKAICKLSVVGVSKEDITFEQCLREEFLINTQNYPQRYHELFHKKFKRAEKQFQSLQHKDDN